ncbi:putative repeat protein (TIGR01451 family) [Pacificibacter maritimus]|uniref:Putative repeat protein (TIGR01451 family) n=2 Tax=Pacificibacter maritimus TaxID=762213 RepID=A0A3N4UJZ8_9RHOB|nr:putative repeat protein (TIGR01451 family) [Pacificibacter maritimus]
MRGFSNTLNVCAASLVAVVACVMSLSPNTLKADPAPAGAIIRNIAEARFYNPDLGLTETVYSNPVEATVAAVPAVEVSGFSALVLSRGAIGQYYFTVENVGNLDVSTSVSMVDLDAQDVKRDGQLYLDVNKNGVVDFGDVKLEPNAEISLETGASSQLIYEFRIAADARLDTIVASQLIVDASAGENENVPVLGIAEGVTELVAATLELEKTQSFARGEDADRLTYTLRMRNNSEEAVAAYDRLDGGALRIDGAPVSGVLLRDAIPLNTVFEAHLSQGAMQPLFHLRDMPLHDYTSVAPADLTEVDAVAFFHEGDYASGFSSDVVFRVRVPHALGPVEIDNTAQVNVTEEVSQPSNTVVYDRLAQSIAALRYVEPSTDLDMVYGAFGLDTSLILSAGACNQSSDIDQVNITLRSTRTGDVETVLATETGPNTGEFRTAAIPLAEMDLPRSEDGVMATSNGDRIVARSDCAQATLEDSLWVNPGNFVFNSVTNDPIEGVLVTLVDAATGALVDSTVTDTQGFFSFDTNETGVFAYRLVGADDWTYPSVRLDFPGYGRIVTEASYGADFAHLSGPPQVADIPVDPFYGTPLSLEKTVDRDQVAFGEFVTYTLDVTNNMYQALMHTTLMDSPPRGVNLVQGSVRFDGAVLPDPTRDAVGDLSFDLGTLKPLSSYELSYTMQVSAGAREGDNINTALFSGYQAGTGTLRSSPVARARVSLNNSGGVFARQGTVIGSVFMDCDGDGIRDTFDDEDRLGRHAEPGIPGVRIVTDQGLSVVTDIDGKYSLYGLSAVTHAFLVQPETLPKGSEIQITRTNDLGRAGSRLVPLKKGELRAEHFAVQACTPEIMNEIDARRTWFETNAQTEALRAADLPLVGSRAATRSARTEAGVATTSQLSPAKLQREAEAVGAETIVQKSRSQQRSRPLSQLMNSLDNTTGFIGLEDGQVLDRRSASIRVKSNMDLSLSLIVNGREVDADRIGERSTLDSKNLQAVEFVAVSLRGDQNTLTLVGRDPFGIERERVELTLFAPSNPAKVEVIAPEVVNADPTTPFPVVVRILDTRGRPVLASSVVTLEARRATWDVEDIRPNVPGVQVFIDNGEATFDVIPPQVSGPDRLGVRAGFDDGATIVEFTPNLDERILIGVIEGAITLGGDGAGTLLPKDQFSHFEDTTEGLRGSLYLKGVIRGETLLTLRYNSDRDTESRLFRDIRGDEYYPVYGDNSERGFDAQSSSNLFVKVEKGRSYMLYGDIDISPEAEAFKLGGLSRVVTGAKAHWSDERTSVTVFAARTNAEQKIIEIRGRGVSGPYDVDLSGYIDGSERVEVLVRDEEGGDVISTELLRRGTDYLLDFFSNTITFDRPLRQFDLDGNPISVRMTFEIEAENAEKYWIYGGEINHTLNERTMVGARLVHADAERGHDARTRVVSGYVAHEARNGGDWEAEIARSEDKDGTAGMGARLAYEISTENSRFSAEAIYTNNSFAAPGALANAGTTQMRFSYGRTLSRKAELELNGEYVEDRITDAKLTRLDLLYRYQMEPHLGWEIGAEIAQRTAAGESKTQSALIAGVNWVPQDRDNTRVDARLRFPVSGDGATELTLGLTSEPEKGWTVYSETELRFNKGATITRFAMGFDYQMTDWLTGTFDLSRGAGDLATTYTQGVDAVWDYNDFTSFTLGIEHSREMETSRSKLTSVALGAKWSSADDTWVGDADLEATFEPTGETYYASLGMAGKLNDDWTVLGRSRIALDNRDGDDSMRIRTRIGAAYRPLNDPRMEVLAWYEHRLEEKHGTTQTHMWSVDATYEASADLRLNAKYAGQHQNYRLPGHADAASLTQLVQAGVNQEFSDDRFQVGANISHLWDDAGNRSVGLGAELGFVPAKGTQIAIGYNHSRGQVAGQSDLYQDGLYLRFNLLLDNSLWNHLDQFLGN